MARVEQLPADPQGQLTQILLYLVVPGKVIINDANGVIQGDPAPS